MVMPPFLYLPGDDEEYAALAIARPDLHAELEAEMARKAREDDWPEARPCFWYDAATATCRNYDHRPEICRDFPVGEESCLEHRKRAGM